MFDFNALVSDVLPETGFTYCPKHRAPADSVQVEQAWHEPFDGGTDISIRFDWRGSSRLAVVALGVNELGGLEYPDACYAYINRTIWDEVEFCVGLLAQRLEERPE